MISTLHPGSGVKEAEEEKNKPKTRAAGGQKYSEVKREKEEKKKKTNKYADFSPRLLLPNGAKTPSGRL